MRHKGSQKPKAGVGNNAKDMEVGGGKTKEETHVICKEVGVRKREQVTPEGYGEMYRKVLRREFG
jgi:hypothetical protein